MVSSLCSHGRVSDACNGHASLMAMEYKIMEAFREHNGRVWAYAKGHNILDRKASNSAASGQKPRELLCRKQKEQGSRECAVGQAHRQQNIVEVEAHQNWTGESDVTSELNIFFGSLKYSGSNSSQISIGSNDVRSHGGKSE